MLVTCHIHEHNGQNAILIIPGIREDVASWSAVIQLMFLTRIKVALCTTCSGRMFPTHLDALQHCHAVCCGMRPVSSSCLETRWAVASQN
jgi:hypothetical protein